MNDNKTKNINKETVSFVLAHDFILSRDLLNEIVETIWRSDERLEEIQQGAPNMKKGNRIFAKGAKTSGRE